MTVLAPTSGVDAAKIMAALKIGAGIDWKGAIAAFESEDTQAKIVDGLILAEDAAAIVGVFFPPAAVVANDIGVAVAVEPLIYQALAWISKQPGPARVIAGAKAWGQSTEFNIVATAAGWWHGLKRSLA